MGQKFILPLFELPESDAAWHSLPHWDKFLGNCRETCETGIHDVLRTEYSAALAVNLLCKKSATWSLSFDNEHDRTMFLLKFS